MAVLIDNFISATVEMEADKAAAEAAVLKRKEQVPAPPGAPPRIPGLIHQPRILAWAHMRLCCAEYRPLLEAIERMCLSGRVRCQCHIL